MLILLFVGSCNGPPAVSGEPHLVTAKDLYRIYHDDPGSAVILYTGQTVRVFVTAFNTVGAEIHWRPIYTVPLAPPAVVFRFDAPPPKLKAPVWIEGTCAGDGTGAVLVTGCRAGP
jgi:hypothetical protein